MQVFICHSSDLAEPLRELRQQMMVLREAWRIYLSSDDGERPDPIRDWQQWIRASVRNCDIVIYAESEGASASAWCQAELGMAFLLDRPVLALTSRGTEHLPEMLAPDQAMALDSDPAEIATTIEEFFPEPVIAATGTPFQGMKPLGQGDGALLVGRSELVLDILHHVEDSRASELSTLTLVAGPSGCGKSSLLAAGLGPALRRANYDVVGPVLVSELLENEELLDPGAVLVLDQAEQLMTLSAELQARAFALLRNHRETAPLVIGVRDDQRTAIERQLEPSANVYVPILSTSDLAEVVRRPVKLARGIIDERLVTRLVTETETASALPLLTLTLEKLWAKRDPKSKELREEALDQLGGVGGVLEKEASRALRRCVENGADKTHVLGVLSRLADASVAPPIRLPLPLAQLSTQQRSWIEQFRRVGLVTRHSLHDPGDMHDVVPKGDLVVSATHDRFFSWEPLEQQIEADHERNKKIRLIIDQRDRWKEGDFGAADEVLLRGELLDLAESEPSLSKVSETEAFIRASRDAERSRRLRSRATRVLVGLSIGLVGAVAVAVWQWQESSAAEDRARVSEQVAQSVRTAAQASAIVDSRRDVALLAAVAAYQRDANAETEGALLDAVNRPIGPHRYAWASSSAPIRAGHTSKGEVILADTGAMTLIDPRTGESRALMLPELSGATGISFGSSTVDSLLPFEATMTGGQPIVGVIDVERAWARFRGVPGEVASTSLDSTALRFGDRAGGTWSAPLDDESIGEPVKIHEAATSVVAVSSGRGSGLVASSSAEALVVFDRGDGASSDIAELDWPQPDPTETMSNVTERVAFRPRTDDVELYTSGENPGIYRWVRTESGDLISTEVARASDTVASVWFDASGETLFVGTDGGSIERWDVSGATVTPIGERLGAHQKAVRGGGDAGGWIYSFSDSELVIWDLESTRSFERAGVVPIDWTDLEFAALVSGDGPLAAVTESGRVVITGEADRVGPPNSTHAAWWGDEIVVATGPEFRGFPRSEIRALGPDSDELIASDVAHFATSACRIAYLAGTELVVRTHESCDGADHVRNVGNVGEGAAVAIDQSDDATVYAALGKSLVRFDLTEDDSTVLVELQGGAAVTALAHLGGTRFAVGFDRPGSTLLLVDADSGTQTEILGHNDAVFWLEHRAGRLATGGEDGMLILTDVDSATTMGSPLIASRRRFLNDRDGEVAGLRFHDDGSALVALHGSTLVTWELSPDALVAEACSRAARPLGGTERPRLGVDAASMSPCDGV